MAEKTERKMKKTEDKKLVETISDHSSLSSTRGRTFEGTVTKKFPKRVVIEFERTVFVKKYERFYRKKTRLHARLPDVMASQINVGEYIKIRECRPLSKIIHFIVIEKIRSLEEMKNKNKENKK